jgi:hypothetical protein
VSEGGGGGCHGCHGGVVRFGSRLWVREVVVDVVGLRLQAKEVEKDVATVVMVASFGLVKMSEGGGGGEEAVLACKCE